MQALASETQLGDNYIGVHWRRGDRGHPEMGALGDLMWQLSSPEHLSCELNRLLLEWPAATSVFVGTNCGTPADRALLRRLVHVPLVFLSDLDLFGYRLLHPVSLLHLACLNKARLHRGFPPPQAAFCLDLGAKVLS